ncbi:MAG: cytochrome c peroxidase [Isosphaeraceae bacterium]|nr:cytochrome c peroxidase [Isosphaeraceae bacterium]
MKTSRIPTIALILGCALLAIGLVRPSGAELRSTEPDITGSTEPHRSPIAIAISKDGKRLLTANQTSGSVSLIDATKSSVLGEIRTGDKPAGVAIAADGRRAVVTHWYGYDLAILDLAGDRLAIVGRVEVGPEPRGVVIDQSGRFAYAAVGVADEVVKVDLEKKAIAGRVAVGREPRSLALSPDGKFLAVAHGREQTIAIVDLLKMSLERSLPTQGDNLRQVVFDASGTFVYAANLFNRGFATTKSNIDAGWVVGQRVTRVKVDGSAVFETLSLDIKGRAAADVVGVGLSRSGEYLAVASGGTHEVMLFSADDLPWRSNGSRDLMEPRLSKDKKRFRRIATGGRPTELVFAPDSNRLYVANYFGDSVQTIDAETGEITATLALGSPRELSLVRRGEQLFHDATRSFNQWYSCNTCHADGGHTSGLDFDTMNDGWHDYSQNHLRSRKKVPTLRRTTFTQPWTWHGWQKSVEDAVQESFTKSMQGKAATDLEVRAVAAFLGSLEFPRNPYRTADGGLTEQAKRGEAIFRSAKAACSSCHSGPEFTDGKIHEVGLETNEDYYRGYNPPSLRGVYDKDPYLHDRRAKTLEDVITGPHNPENLGGESLSATEVADLIAYLKSL